MKKLFAICIFLFFGCVSVRQEDLDAWHNVPVRDLEIHPFFSSLPLTKQHLSDGSELWNYRNGGRVVSNCNQFGCVGTEVVCTNQFLIKDGIVKWYKPIGRCYTDCSTRPASKLCTSQNDEPNLNSKNEIENQEKNFNIADTTHNKETNQVIYNHTKEPITGFVLEHDSDGNLLSKVEYQNGVPNGDLELYYPDGKIKRKATTKNQTIIGTVYDYSESGKLESEIDVKDDNPVVKRSYDKNGALEIEDFFDQKGNGLRRTYFKNGKIKSEIPYIDNKENGVGRLFDENEVLFADYTYKNGARNGISHIYYPNGALRSKGAFKNDKLEGMLHWFYQNGKIHEIEYHVNGKREGWRTIYSTEGNQCVRLLYSKDKIISSQKSNGKILTSAEILNLSKSLPVDCN